VIVSARPHPGCLASAATGRQTAKGTTMQELLRPIDIVSTRAIAYGPGKVSAVGPWAEARGFRRPLVIADIFHAGRLDILGLPGAVAAFTDIRREPEISDLDAALAVAASTRPDLIVGFGGGSTMDVAKLVAALAGSDKSIKDVAGVERVPGRPLALVQVATTAGTGSEAGNRSLITEPATHAKLVANSNCLVADLAVVDPDLTVTVPPRITANTGVDALAHCVEAYTNRLAHPIIDLYALEGIRLIGRFLPRAIADGTDREARAGLALASLYGGFCLGPVNTAAGHALAYPLGTRRHVAHGASNALMFPHVLAFNAPAVAAQTATILTALGLPPSSDQPQVFESTYEYCRGLGIEMRMSRLGVEEGDLASMADEAHAIRRLLDNNPRQISRDEILAIYRKAF
jgi:alcohol dehydrogenase